jgi:hypothetical protein
MSWDGPPFLENLPPLYATLLSLAFFITMWCGISVVIARTGGWADLAVRYRLEGPFRGRKWHFRSAGFGQWTSYGGVLTVGANSRGLYLAVMPLFRVGHPPLFIPWEDVRKTASHRLWMFGAPLDLGTVAPVTVTFYWGLVRKLEAEIGREIPGVGGA